MARLFVDSMLNPSDLRQTGLIHTAFLVPRHYHDVPVIWTIRITIVIEASAPFPSQHSVRDNPYALARITAINKCDRPFHHRIDSSQSVSRYRIGI
jgi:hypothetical protein